MFAIDQTSATLATMADELRRAANAADGKHSWQDGGTYGAACEAVVTALEVGLGEANGMSGAEARELAERIMYEIAENGDSVVYNLGVCGIEIVA
ncbi:MAG: hypothetical protein ACRCYU_23515 [Nocardioides sp.]